MEGLWLSIGKNVPESRCGGRKGVGSAITKARAFLVSYGLCDLEQDTNLLWTLVFLPSKWGHTMPLLFLSLLAGFPVLKNMGRRGQADFFWREGWG